LVVIHFSLFLFFMFIELRIVGISPTQMSLGHSDPTNKVSGINILWIYFM